MKLRNARIALSLCLIALSPLAAAAPHVSVSQPKKTFAEMEVERAQREDTKKILSPAEKALAEKWQLNDDDWLKFKDIMSGPRGMWNPNLDPLTALGVEATSPAERRRYAEIWMRVETQRTEKELAFERERMAAAKRLYPDTPIMDYSGKISKTPGAGSPPQHYVVFGKINCRTCESIVSGFTSNLRTLDILDIYVVDARTDEQVRQFAAENSVDIDKVKRGQITLNWQEADKRLAELGAPAGELPMVYGRAGDAPWQRMQ